MAWKKRRTGMLDGVTNNRPLGDMVVCFIRIPVISVNMRQDESSMLRCRLTLCPERSRGAWTC